MPVTKRTKAPKVEATVGSSALEPASVASAADGSVTYDPGETLPVASQSRDDTENGDVTQQEDAYFGFVLSGELLVSTSRGGSTSGDAARTVSVDVVGAGRTYFSLAACETRDGCVFRYGADTVRVSSARGATPATVALLQGMDVAELPRSLRDLLFRRAVVHARWRPPAPGAVEEHG